MFIKVHSNIFSSASFVSARRCAANRGEMFMFQALSDKPVLIALVSGDAANAVEEVPDQFVVAKAMNFLSAVFGSACPKEVSLFHFVAPELMYL